MSTLYQASFSAHIFFAQFWPKISEGFHDTPMLRTGFIVLGIVLGIVLLFILGYLLYSRFWPGNEPEDVNPFKISSSENIRMGWKKCSTGWCRSICSFSAKKESRIRKRIKKVCI